jgi:hypothetical protein
MWLGAQGTTCTSPCAATCGDQPCRARWPDEVVEGPSCNMVIRLHAGWALQGLADAVACAYHQATTWGDLQGVFVGQ